MKEHSKLFIHTKRILYLSFYIFLVVLSFKLNMFNEYNTYQKLFMCPFLVVLYGFNSIMSFQLSYILLYVVTLILLADAGNLPFLVKKYILLFKKLIDIKKEPTHNDEEYIAQTNKMLDLMEAEHFSLITVFLSVLSTFLYINFIVVIVNQVFNFDLPNADNYKFLFFDLSSSNLILFLSSLTIIILLNLFLIFKRNKEKRIIIFQMLFYGITISLLLRPLYNSCSFDLFFLLVTIKTFILYFIRRYKNEKNSIQDK